MSSQQTDIANLMELSDPSKAAFKDLEEENIQLKRQVRNLEADKLKSSAVLNQEIEFLKTQIAELKEREEKGKSLNKNILDALQDLNNSAEKKRLSVQAREELNKAEKQYNRSLSEHKKRSKEENQKLEKENKKLKQALTEKEAQIKGLRFAIDELQGGYESFRNFMQRNESSFYDEKGSSRSRISTMADDFKDKETNGKILKLEKDLEQIRETVREQSMRLSETTFESARSRNAASPLLMENISLSRISHRAQNNRGDKRSIVTSALDDNSYLKIPNEYYSESGGGVSAKSEIFSRKNEVNSEKLLRLDYNTADHLLSDDMLTPIKKESGDIVFQEPKISSFDVIESRVTDFDLPKTREGVHEIQQLFSEREFQYEEQMVYNSKMQHSQCIAAAVESEYQSVPAPRAVHQYQYSEHIVYENGQISPISPIRREDENESKRDRKVPVPVITNMGRYQKENYEDQAAGFGGIRSGYNSARTIYTPRTNEYSERGGGQFYGNDSNLGGMKTEIKYMIGRLMKVKNKLDKQTEQLNLSRSPSISPHSRRNSYAIINGKVNRGKKPSINLKRAETFQPLNQIEGLRMEKKSATTPDNYQARYY